MTPIERARTLSHEQIADLLVALDVRSAETHSREAELAGRLAHREMENVELKRRLAWLERQVFGAISERRILGAVTPADQLLLLEEMLEPSEEPPPENVTVAEHERKQRKRAVSMDCADSQLKFDDSVPRQVIELANPEIEGISESELELVDVRSTYRLAQSRAPYVLLEYRQKVYKIKKTQQLSCPPLPRPVIEKSSADVSFLANMLVDKFRYHLPLHRQHQRLEQAGIFLARSTLTRLVHRAAQMLELLYSSLLSSVLQSRVLAMDESPTPAGRAKGKTKTGYFWVLYGDQAEVAFIFAPTRARSVIDAVLKDFSGTLLTDGYAAYSSFVKDTQRVEHAQCWAHTRRKFIEAEDTAPEACRRVLSLIQQLYEVEREAKDPSTLSRLREQRSAAVVDQIFQSLRHEMEQTVRLPRHPYTKAADYALAREHPLRVFLHNPQVPLDTNHVERSLRGAAVGRKNWMFHSTEDGARYAGICYSLIQSCVSADVDPSTYLIDIFQRMDTHPASRIHELLPREWKIHFAAHPMRSVLRT